MHLTQRAHFAVPLVIDFRPKGGAQIINRLNNSIGRCHDWLRNVPILEEDCIGDPFGPCFLTKIMWHR